MGDEGRAVRSLPEAWEGHAGRAQQKFIAAHMHLFMCTQVGRRLGDKMRLPLLFQKSYRGSFVKWSVAQPVKPDVRRARPDTASRDEIE